MPMIHSLKTGVEVGSESRLSGLCVFGISRVIYKFYEHGFSSTIRIRLPAYKLCDS